MHNAYIPKFEDGEEVLSYCPLCGGQLIVVDDDLVICKDCKKHIGLYIANAGAIRLHPKIMDYLSKSSSAKSCRA